MNEDDVLQKVLAKKSPEEIVRAHLRKVKGWLWLSAFFSIFAAIVFFPYGAITGEINISEAIPVSTQAMLLLGGVVVVAISVYFQLRRIFYLTKSMYT